MFIKVLYITKSSYECVVSMFYSTFDKNLPPPKTCPVIVDPTSAEKDQKRREPRQPRALTKMAWSCICGRI